jgi:hypothetical protein
MGKIYETVLEKVSEESRKLLHVTFLKELR